MDSSYLHKKFKKQQCLEPKISHNAQGEKEGAPPPPGVQNKENQKVETTSQQCSEDRAYNSVPIHSTNNQSSSLNLSSSAVPPPPPPYDNFVVKSSISSDVGNLIERTDKSLVNTQFSNNGISYVISNQNKTYTSFDTKIMNDYEPTPSSILDNVYSNSKNSYVTSKLVNFINKAEDTFSSSLGGVDYVESASLGECKKDGQEGPIPVDKISVGKYVCNYCNLVCSKPSVLQKHIRAHTNERPFPCISCGFSFKTRSNLYKHCRSRTHANRVMGNKAQEITQDMDIDAQIKSEYASPQQNYQCEEVIPIDQEIDEKRIPQDVKLKPYKPRFKACFDGVSKENEVEANPNQTQANPHLLSLHINELIHKNNSIVNSNDAHLLRKRSVIDNYYTDNINNSNDYARHKYIENNDEPLNLTNKNRKRCLSEITEPTAQKSLIKELLLKNLYADTNKQCPYCKMIFQTVTELDLHKLRSCKGFTKTGARYSRSSSVNVASILTQNKNAFDTNPHVPNTPFPLKSPGPFLGKTRLVESDKAKSFSFDDGIQSSFQSPHDLLRTSQRYSLSPLTLQPEKSRKPPVKLFGGEVKITHTSGETKCFKIDDQYNSDNSNFEYGNKLSENRVVKSTLQSGGTVLQNKPVYEKQESLRGGSPEVIRVYENTPGVDAVNLEKTKFCYGQDMDHRIDTTASENNLPSPSCKYTNIMDFSQKAVKLFAPNLKQPNLAIPGLPIPNSKFSMPLAVDTKPFELPSKNPTLDDHRMNISPAAPVYKTKEIELEKPSDFTQKHHAWLDHNKIVPPEPSLHSPKTFGCTPVNVLVNGKVVRYVPGIPGPIVAEAPLDMAYTTRNLRLQKPNIKVTPVDTTTPPPRSPFIENYPPKTTTLMSYHPQPEKNKSPKLEVKVETGEMRSPKSSGELKSPKIADSKFPVVKSPNHQVPSSTEAPRKFARPNSLALKPSMSVLKQHHGLTPTMFNQILISPDTPRVAKKYNHQILHGNYFSYLGLKSSTKSVYCTLNKTQPFYVPHFKKLSMYSEWRQQDNKSDKLYVSAYDSRQKQQKFTTAGTTRADLIVHSSYKFTISEIPATKEEASKSILLGGYESNEDYTYVRGRGRGRYVCDQCGIRCKKPSMLKKHIRTHSNDRPYTCDHCNFSFKTKGNLTKHMKSKAHTKNSAVNSSSSSNSSAQQSGTPSSDSETDDSGMDSSDESTRQQEHEAAYGLLSLSQKPASSSIILPQNDRLTNLPLQQNPSSINLVSSETTANFMDTEQIAHVTKTNYAKNKILDQQTKRNFHPLKFCEVTMNIETEPHDSEHLTQFLGKSSTNRPLTYPYMSVVPSEKPTEVKNKTPREWDSSTSVSPEKNEPKSIKQFNVVKRYNVFQQSTSDFETDNSYKHLSKHETTNNKLEETAPPPSLNEKIILPESPQNLASDLRKRKVTMDSNFIPKMQRNDSEVIDLSMSSSINEKKLESQGKQNGFIRSSEVSYMIGTEYPHNKLSSKIFMKNKVTSKYDRDDVIRDEYHPPYDDVVYKTQSEPPGGLTPYTEDVQRRDETISCKDIRMDNEIIREQTSESPNSFKQLEYDNSAMETLADIATKQVKLEKNSLAKNVATEFLMLATKNEYQNRDSNSFVSNSGKDMNELIVKSEENKNCTICSKSFIKPSQLRLHMNIHYLERPFRCDSCSVSFRTKGHLQKHERSAGHHNKLSSSPTLSSSEPRPFKCSDCNIAFRIHGHLAKHLRSKMHIMKLECLAKIPFGLYAELERSNSLLTEINTTDGDQCLESLKMLAKKVFINDPGKLNQLGPSSLESVDTDS